MQFNKHGAVVVAKMPLEFSPRTLVQFYRASPEFVQKHGGEFFDLLIRSVNLDGGKYISIDSRSHMLMRGWYPCIPGWHCDDFWRPDGQPDLENLRPIKHYAVVLGAEVSATQFVDQPIELPSPTELYEVFDSDKPLYGYYNQMIDEGNPATKKVQSGQVIKFSGLDFHCGLPAEREGWRSFTRITVSDHREPKNEIRTQTQVYLTRPFDGW